MANQRILLIGGGHSHVEVLRRFALAPAPGIALTLVSPDTHTPYSGMLPGLVAGHYTFAEAHVDLPPLAAWAGARFVRERVVALDPGARVAQLASGALESFDIVSLDVGSTPAMSIPGAHEYAIGVKPVAQFLHCWRVIEDETARGRLQSIAVVGGGAGGVELLLALQFRLIDRYRDRAPGFRLITDQPQLLPRHVPGVRRWLAQRLSERDVALHLGARVVAIEPRTVVLADGTRLAADHIVFATSASAAPWLAESGLACDAAGFVRVDACLRSTSHPAVFAAGDCASLGDRTVVKSGVYAVRQGPPLAANLKAAATAGPLVRYSPQRTTLALISTGDRSAIASYGPLAIAGRWVWRWKDRIDRNFMARYRRG